MRSLFFHRPYLRCLNKAQRRSWAEQRKRLTPRVAIGSAYIRSGARPQNPHESDGEITLTLLIACAAVAIACAVLRVAFRIVT